MFNFYFSGHSFEYEARNTLRIFDLNTEYEIKDYSNFENNIGLGLFSILEINCDEYIGYAQLYFNKDLLYEAKISSNSLLMERENENKLKKLVIVKSIYQVLSKYHKVKSNYGILTGVRPVKILSAAKDNGKTNEEINDILINTYEISPEKVMLLWDVFKIEEKYINREINDEYYNLYIGIPFCPSKCSYCSFTTYVKYKEIVLDKYVNTLVYETEKTIELAISKNLKLHSIYIGGGTPSVLNVYQINLIFDTLKKYYNLSEIMEITFEAGRPDTITEEKLIALKNNCVNRISINPQTMNQHTLINIGRNHSISDIKDKFALARRVGFETINMDIILGLPNEDEIDVKNTINEILKLKPENITVHSLSYKTGSELKAKSNKQLTKDYELLSKMHETSDKRCTEDGYKPYYMYRQKNIKGNSENIGYTVAGKESIYNIVIIEEIETILACGAGVSSKIMLGNNNHETVYSFKGIEEYEIRINEILEKKKILLNI